MFPSTLAALEAHMDAYVASRHEAMQNQRFGQPSFTLRILGRAAGRIAASAAIIEAWTRGASEVAAAPARPTTPRTVTH